MAFYELSITATDRGSAAGGVDLTSKVANLHITVLDANDNDPVLDASTYQKNISEATTVNSLVLSVSVTDEDADANAEVRFSLVGDQGMFDITDAGDIMLAKGLDREAVNRYAFTVTATDKGFPPRSTSSTVVVVVLDYNDNQPIFEKPLYIATRPEDVAGGSQVIGVRATDLDSGINQQLSYSLIAIEPLATHFEISDDGEGGAVISVTVR